MAPGWSRSSPITSVEQVPMAGCSSFDEIEVEQLHGRGAKQARRAVVAALRNAGCRRGRQLPKLMRVLDAEGLGPPDVVLPRLTSDPNVSDAVGYALARSVDQILFHDPRVRLGGNDEDLHQFRVALRRLRSDLSTFAVLLDMASADSLRHELGWLAGTTSARRTWMSFASAWRRNGTRWPHRMSQRLKSCSAAATSSPSWPTESFSKHSRASGT